MTPPLCSKHSEAIQNQREVLEDGQNSLEPPLLICSAWEIKMLEKASKTIEWVMVVLVTLDIVLSQILIQMETCSSIPRRHRLTWDLHNLSMNDNSRMATSPLWVSKISTTWSRLQYRLERSPSSRNWSIKRGSTAPARRDATTLVNYITKLTSPDRWGSQRLLSQIDQAPERAPSSKPQTRMKCPIQIQSKVSRISSWCNSEDSQMHFSLCSLEHLSEY